jgi:hypothetical protein
MSTVRIRRIATNFHNLTTWGNIRPDDEKMMFCARQAAHIIPVEQMIELAMAAHILDTFPIDAEPDGYRHLKKMFDCMVLFAIRDGSALADSVGIAQD